MKDYHYLKRANTPFIDRHVTKVTDLIKTWDGNSIHDIGLIGVPLSKTSISHSGAAFAPQTIRKALGAFTTYSIDDDLDLSSWKIDDLGDVTMHVTDLLVSQNRVYETLEQLFLNHPHFIPIVLGGDNSISYPTIKAFSKAKGKVGVIQFDAHHDVRNLEDGGPSNGTPFRSLIESKTIQGKHLVQVGIRDFANSREYRTYAKENDVVVHSMKEVRERNIVDILKADLEIIKKDVDVIYVSVDMDVLDQSQAPGCPAIGPGGMDAITLFEAISYLAQDEKVKGLEIVELDPTVDFRDMTSRVAAHVILNFLKGKQKSGYKHV
ncbi:formimidoylglutamase [Bacillus solimangrovi]|uniref:Formimidoylglutamase n=1 Tax=Bacillus solimangrovi TaxID=1305675 RepID=A0A1E5LBF0_9BACI|nr:formimidoylglutamase [Bacillus solimangrovi]OEH91414.1 formimidoylglutamase [Bacillus solimangrovi]